MRFLNWGKISSNRTGDYTNQLCNRKSSADPGDITAAFLFSFFFLRGHIIAWFLKDIPDRLMAAQKSMFPKIVRISPRTERISWMNKSVKPDSLPPNTACTHLGSGAITRDPEPVWLLSYWAPCSSTPIVYFYQTHTGWLRDVHDWQQLSAQIV